MNYHNASESESNTSDSENGETPITDWLEIADLDPGPCRTIPVKKC
jgi:hypothetical protein